MALAGLTGWCLSQSLGYKSNSGLRRAPKQVATCRLRAVIAFAVLTFFTAGLLPDYEGSQVLIGIQISLIGLLSFMSTQRVASRSPGWGVAFVALWTLVMIGLFAIGYSRSELLVAETHNLLDITLPGGHSLLRFGIERHTPADLASCLYFSVVTQTTLGFGDIVPRVGSNRLLSGFQALLAFVWMGWSLALFLNWINKGSRD